MNEIQTVLVTEISHDKHHFVGHNKYYEQVLLPMRNNLLGKSVQVKIVSATKFSMSGELIDSEDKWKECSNIKNEIVVNKNGGFVHKSNGFISSDNNYVQTNGEVTNEEVTEGQSVASSHYSQSQLIVFGLISLGLAFVYNYVWKMLSEV